MGFFCKSCDTAIKAPYEWWGMSVACPSCASVAPLQMREGQPVPMSSSGSGLTFRSFVGLLNTSGWREEAQPLIQQLLGCSIEKRGEAFVLKAPNGELIPYEVAHLQLQASSNSRGDLYELAMSLWR